MQQIWTDKQKQFLIDNLELSDKTLTKKYNSHFSESRSYDSIQKKVKSLRREMTSGNPFVFQKEDIEPLVDLPELEEKEFGEELDLWIKTISGYYQGESFASLQSQDSSLVIVLSDLHFGKKTKRFNIAKAKEWLSSIPSMLVSKYKIRPFDEIVVCLIGDIVEGEDIYSTQNGVLECPVIIQVQESTECLYKLVLDLEKTFDCPVRVETVYGNHGRMSKSADVRSNWDNAVYLMLSQLIQQNENSDIVCNLNFEEFKVAIVKDKKLLLTHHGTKHMGTPAMQVKFLGWIMDEEVDLLAHGHWHQWKIESHNGRIMLSNGSLSGPDDLSRQMGLSEPPRQGYFLVTPGQSIQEFAFLQWNS